MAEGMLLRSNNYICVRNANDLDTIYSFKRHSKWSMHENLQLGRSSIREHDDFTKERTQWGVNFERKMASDVSRERYGARGRMACHHRRSLLF